MNEFAYFGMAAVVFALQVILSVKGRRRIVKWIPALLVFVLSAACFGAYAVSGFANWGWLILLMLTAGMFIPIVLALAICGIIRRTKYGK